MGSIRTYLQNNKHLYLQVLIPSIVFLYLAFMCTRDYTWVFVSSDGGDWLASALEWMVPQPYGAPVYIVLSHVVSDDFSTILPWAMAVLLSALPTAITTFYTYLIVKHITYSTWISLTGAILVGGSAVLLTQSTVIEIMALSVTFLTAAFYYYLMGKRYMTVILLALGVGVHILILPIALFWLVVEIVLAYRTKSYRELKAWLLPIVTFIIITGAMYSIILLLMYLPTPRYMAGELSWNSIVAYWTKTSQAIVGEISIFETPSRLWFWFKLMFMCFGVALIPLCLAFKRPISKYVWVLTGTTVFTLWYFITCLDVLAWTYISFATPSIIILACIGLSKLSSIHLKAVFAYSCIILIINPIFMNANTLTQARPQGRELLSELEALPQNAIVVVDPGAEGFGVIYYSLSHPDYCIVPLLDQNLDNQDFYATKDYTQWLEQTYHLGLDYTNTLTAIQSALDRSYLVYYVDYNSGSFERCFNLEGTHTLKRVTSLTGLPREPAVIWEVE